MKVEIASVEVMTETTSKGTVLHKQRAVAHVAPGYDLNFDVSAEGGKAYPVGVYTLSPRSYKVGRFGGLEIDGYNTKLVPEAKASVRAA